MLALTVTLLSALATLTISPATASATDPAASLSRVTVLNQRLAELSPYITGSGHQQRLDIPAARTAGFDTALIDLAAQLIQYQNHAAGPTLRPRATEYPAVAALFADATFASELRKKHPATSRRSLDVTAVNPCGDFTNPLPAANPARVLIGPVPDAVAELLGTGFHYTSGYVCGLSNNKKCGYDFTRPRDYSSHLGFCPASALRDQATLTSAHSTEAGDAYWYQEGEPNPETADYPWPYWNWGSYVIWWHDTY